MREASRYSRRFYCLLLLLFSVLLLLEPAAATITVLETGQRFASRQDKSVNAKRLWKGYEYMARLQYIDGNLPLCPKNNNDNSVFNVTVPADGVPVALLVRGGGCSVKEKANFALKNIVPPDVVRYLIIDGERQAEDEEEYHGYDITADDEDWSLSQLPVGVIDQEQTIFYDDDLMEELRKKDRHGDDNNDEEIPLFLIRVSFKTEYEILELLLHQTAESKSQGGPRITIDSRLGTGTLNDGAMFWIAMSALLTACVCSFCLIASGGYWDDEEEPQAPQRRPQRRRLTREQVRNLLPQYRYDGTCLRVMERSSTAQQQQQHQQQEGSETEGLIATAAPPPDPVELSLCSICLDDYEVGDKLRCLPCSHAFHSRCIGKWLAERSATCPLCKEDIWHDEEEDEDESETASVREAVTQTGEETNWWDRLYQLARNRGEEEVSTLEQPAAAQVDPEAPPLPLEEGPGAPSQDFPRASWWRRMFPLHHRRTSSDEQAAVETTPISMLSEPLLQSAEEEAPSPAVTAQAEASAQVDDGHAESAAAQEQQQVPDPPENQTRQVTI